MFFFFFKQKTAYEMRISDWSSDVCLPIWLPDVVRVKTSAGRTATCVGFSLRPTAALNAVRALKVREQLMSAFGAGRAEGKAIGKSGRSGPLTTFEIGGASSRESGCLYVWIPVVALSITDKKI